MFKFTIRDLFWLTLVAAVALGWSAREWQLRAEVTDWRMAAGGLEDAVNTFGFRVRWHFKSSSVELVDKEKRIIDDNDPGPRPSVNASFAEPSALEDD